MFYDDYGHENYGYGNNHMGLGNGMVQQPQPQFDELGVPLNLSPNSRRTRRAQAEEDLRKKTQER